MAEWRQWPFYEEVFACPIGIGFGRFSPCEDAEIVHSTFANGADLFWSQMGHLSASRLPERLPSKYWWSK